MIVAVIKVSGTFLSLVTSNYTFLAVAAQHIFGTFRKLFRGSGPPDSEGLVRNRSKTRISSFFRGTPR